MAALKTQTSLALPEDLWTYLQEANGEKWNSWGMIGNWRLLEIKYILDEWSLMRRLAENGSFDANAGQADVLPTIKNYWWNPNWLPIVTSGSGHFFCLDTDPGETGHPGQVILFLHDDPERFLVAESLSQWFEEIAKDLQRGLYTFDPEDGFNNEALMWSALEGHSLYGRRPER
jgi:cell wall assembly regulator SMI1